MARPLGTGHAPGLESPALPSAHSEHKPGGASRYEGGSQQGYARFVGRSIDLMIFSELFKLASSSWLPEASPDELLTRLAGSALFDIAVLPPALLLDALIYAWLGNTPGKALVGLKVVDAFGRNLRFGRYLTRNFRLYWQGLGAGIPLLGGVAALLSLSRIRRGQVLGWDAMVHSQISARSVTTLRVLCAFTGLALLQAFLD